LARGILAGAVLVGLLAAPAGAREQAPKLTVFAAASLTEAFQAFDPSEAYSFAGSNTLAAQIKEGARVDVFASASPQYTQDLFRTGLVEKPVTFATNRLVLIVPKSNPAGVTSVYDLGRKNVKLVVAAPAVPVGSYTRTVLRKLGLSSVLSKVVSNETDVRAVTGKVALGQADAGFVYATDARSVADRVTVIPIPARAQPGVRYEIAVVASSSKMAAAQAWIRMLVSAHGQSVLKRYGFVPLRNT
jgi:molybdate transport system substrate-binding protein